MKILILGAGFGGLELATQLSDEFGESLDIILIDKGEGFVFGFSKLDVMFGKYDSESVFYSYSTISKPGLRFIKATISEIDPAKKSVETTAGIFSGDILIVALGADVDPAATPGLVEGGHEFYSVAGAFALREVINNFKGGNVVVGVTSTPFKCPPAPSETALLMHDFLTDRGLRDNSTISLVIPFGIPIPPSPEASQSLLTAFNQRGIRWFPDRHVSALDPTNKKAMLSDGSDLPYDLFLGIPTHHAPYVVIDSGLTVDGWIPVNSLTLETAFPDIYAIGDVTSVGTAKAGVFSEGQAKVVAREISARVRGVQSDASYDGRGLCYLEFGHKEVGQMDVTFLSGEKPHGIFVGPSVDFAKNKIEFGISRVARWFGGN
jgi:sulfide:quinone oxidoreductase